MEERYSIGRERSYFIIVDNKTGETVETCDTHREAVEEIEKLLLKEKEEA